MSGSLGADAERLFHSNYLGLTHDESQAQSHPEDSENSQKAKDAACAPAADEDDDDLEG